MVHDNDRFVSNPQNLVNVLISVGNDLSIDVTSDGEELNSRINKLLELDKIKTTHLTLPEYTQAIDQLVIDPKYYFEIVKDPMKIGLQLRIHNFDLLKIAYQLYQTYRNSYL